MAKKRRDRWATEASQQTLLRFGPQVDALKELERSAKSTYKTGLAQARGNADATIATIDRAIPTVGGIYDQAGLDQARTASIVNRDIGGLNLSPDLRAAVGLEQADAGSRVSTGRAQALTGLQGQRVAARAGGQYAANKVQADLASALEKVFAQRQSLASQAGTYQALTEGQLTDAARERAAKVAAQQRQLDVTMRGQDITQRGQDISHADRVAAAKAKGKGKTTATGQRLNSADAHSTAREKIQQGLGALTSLDPDKTDRHETAPLLVGGHKGQAIYETVKTPTGGTKRQPKLTSAGTPLTTPNVPGVGTWATIAADVYYDGHLSRANQRKLSKAGYSIKELGLPTYAEWKKTHRPTGPGRNTSYGHGAGAGSGIS